MGMEMLDYTHHHSPLEGDCDIIVHKKIVKLTGELNNFAGHP